jgi:hypothetical protein
MGDKVTEDKSQGGPDETQALNEVLRFGNDCETLPKHLRKALQPGRPDS